MVSPINNDAIHKGTFSPRETKGIINGGEIFYLVLQSFCFAIGTINKIIVRFYRQGHLTNCLD